MGVRLEGGLLPHLDREAILNAYARAPGREVESGKFASPESSAALVANLFGFFMGRADAFRLPSVLGGERVERVRPEQSLRFPWRGGLHPWLDAVIETDRSLLAVESKRYEPFRPKKPPALSPTYWREGVWGADMAGFRSLRDRLRDDPSAFFRLDAAQLVKHALGLHTQAQRLGKRPILLYLFAEPDRWPDGRPISPAWRADHRAEVAAFAEAVRGNAVEFHALAWREFLAELAESAPPDVRRHLEAVTTAFAPLWPGPPDPTASGRRMETNPAPDPYQEQTGDPR